MQGRKKSHFGMSFSCAEKAFKLSGLREEEGGEGEGRGGAKVGNSFLEFGMVPSNCRTKTLETSANFEFGEKQFWLHAQIVLAKRTNFVLLGE